MFVPGVNGSVIPSAPSGSRLKGAYKNSKKRKMPNGGSVAINNISPEGSVAYSYSPSFKSLRGKLEGSTNILTGKQDFLIPSVGASYKGVDLDYTPGNVRASLMTNKLNLDASADFNKNKVVGAAVSGNYQVNPNLSFYGNANYTPKEPLSYGVGFRFNKNFKAGGTRYVPPSKRPLSFTSNAPSTTDNTFVARPYMPIKSAYQMADAERIRQMHSKIKPQNQKQNQYTDNTFVNIKPQGKVKPKINPTPTPKKVSTNKITTPVTQVDNRSYQDNTYRKPDGLEGISGKTLTQWDVNRDYEQANESRFRSPVGAALDILPTPAASYLRSFASIDNRSDNFTEGQKKAVAYAIAKAEEKGNPAGQAGYTGSFGYDDYPSKRQAYNSLHTLHKSDGKFSDKVENMKKNWPSLTAQTTLGRASFKKVNDKEYLIHDKYNFDEHAKDPQSITERLEKIGYDFGVEAETNLVVPKSYVDEAKKQILAEKNAKPVVPTKKEIVAPTKTTVPAKAKAQETYQTTASKKTYSPSPTKSTTTLKSNTSTPATKSSSTLTGERLKVQNYQKMLNEKYGANLETDGAWGKNTQAAYEKYVLNKKMENGGKISNDKQMVDGVAGILRDVKSKQNRLQLANKMAKQFNREKVNYNLSDFLNKAKVKK